MAHLPLYRPIRFASTLAVLLLLAASAGLAASTPLQAAAQAATPKAPHGTAPAASAMQVMISSENCPVLLSARRWGGGAVENVRDGSSPANERGLLLHFDALGKNHSVVQATVIVHGSAYRPHVDPATVSSAGDLSQTFNLANAEREGKESWKLSTDQVPQVKEVDIVSMSFADGTTWKQSENASCRVQPDGLLLVATSR